MILDSDNIQPSRSDGKGNFDLKNADDEENEVKATTRIKKVKSKTVSKHILDYNLADDFEFRCTVHIICTLKITCRSHRKVSTAFKTSHGIQTMYFAHQCITQPMYYTA